MTWLVDGWLGFGLHGLEPGKDTQVWCLRCVVLVVLVDRTTDDPFKKNEQEKEGGKKGDVPKLL